MRRFDGRTAFVAGSTGMAASAARALASEGANVFVASRTAAHARALAGELGSRAAWATADLADEAAVAAAFEACAERFGPRLDALYHVAGISGRRFGDGHAHEATLAGWEAVLRANATSAFLTTRAAVRRMLGQEGDAHGRRGAILLMSSVLARHPSPVHFGTHAYAASKGAIEAFTRAVAAAYAGDGIRVNAVAPALVATPMSRRAQADPAILAYLAERQPLAGGPIEADAVTALALHLLSDDAGMLTGQVIDVDAGWGVSEPRRP
jgi:NAD(P)-dependent dehydrogenase (short-subunit alcohol dehydrogenase family)